MTYITLSIKKKNVKLVYVVYLITINSLWYQNEFKGLYGMQKIQITPSSQIPLKKLTDSIRCHVSANKIATDISLNK